MCKATQCQNPQCDFQKGERLRIPANGCCPECFPQSAGNCQHQGAVYGNENLVIQPGQCCPQCISNPCIAAGKEYKDDQQWQKSSCTTCVCHRGQSRCHTEKCSPLQCDKGEMKVRRPGECCEECVSTKGSCLYESTTRYHGDMWNGTGCEFCTCQRGQVLCQRAECARLECPRGEDLVYLNGKCCPECKPSVSSCVYKHPGIEGEKSTVKSLRRLANLESVSDGPCRECQCQDGHVTCYQRSCPTCPVGTLAMPQQGQCCPECHPAVQCHPDCLTCSTTPDQCNSCKDPGAFLWKGRCVHVCPLGFFPNGRVCAACQPACGTCENSFECTACGGSLLLSGRQCVATCETGLYQDHTQCLSCHDSCSTCHGAGPQDCLSCADPSHLLKDGFCVAECGPGFYHVSHPVPPVSPITPAASAAPMDLHCIMGNAFHIARISITKIDTSAANCVTAHALPAPAPLQPSVLHAPDHFFCTGASVGSHVERVCLTEMDAVTNATHHVHIAQQEMPTAVLPAIKPVSTTRDNASVTVLMDSMFRTKSAMECSGPSQADCTVCPPHASLHNGYCRTSCPEGQYLNAVGFCSECQEGCQRCTSDLQLSSGTVCLWCKGSQMLLLGDRCVQNCPPGHYKHHGACKKCHASCAECSGEGSLSCSSCTAPDVLAPSGMCTSRCPVGFYADETQVCQMCDRQCRTCEMAGVCMSCRDPAKVLLFGECQYESCAQQYYLNTTTHTCRACPSSCVECVSAAQCRICSKNMFIKNGHCTPDCGHGYYADRKTRECQANTHAPSLHINGSFLVSIGEVTPLNRSLLSIKDSDSQSENLLLQLIQPPSNGQLTVLENGRERTLHKDDTFSLTQVQNRAVRFVHSAAQSKAVLYIEDYDNPQDVLLMVLEPPQHGRLARVHGDGQVSRFKLEELVREQLQYIHDGSSGEQDRFLLQINDGHSYQNVLVHVTVAQRNGVAPHMRSIPKTWVREGGMVQLSKKNLKAEYKGASDSEIIYTIQSDGGQPQHGEIVLVSMASDGPVEAWQAFPQSRDATPTSSFTQQDVNEGTVWYRHYGRSTQKEIFQFQVSAEAFADTRSDAQTFTIGVMPQTPGTLEHKERPNTHVLFFTQADVDAGKIIYRPPQAPSHLQELYQYSFTVSDGYHTTPEMDFSILLLPNHQQPPVFQILDPVLEVSLGGRAPIGGQQLAVTDADTAPDELEFELVEAPVHGTLIRVDFGSQTPMINGDTFTFSDITRNVLQYEHSGLSTEEDAMIFSVTDGMSMTSTTVQVTVLEVKGHGPRRDANALLSIEVAEKSSTVIRRSHLAYVDNDSSDDKIRIQLVSVPMYGILTKTNSASDHEELNEYSTFTMADINHHKIRYVTSFDTGNQPVTDIFHFIVYDAENNRLDNQMCTITITSVQRQPPVVTVRSGIKVQEGGRVQLSANHIIASDPDTSQKDLLVWLISPPKYGFIENTKRAGSVGETRVISPDVPFTVEDLTSDHIFYVQNVHQANVHQDVFSFYISDGSSQTEAFDVTIDIQQTKEDRIPVISVNSIHLEENTGIVITNASLSVLDLDTPENEIVLTIIKKPSYGKLRRRQFYSQPLETGKVLQQGSTFTYQDILDELLVYTPDTHGSATDEILFSVTDGVHTETGRLEFSMDVKKSEGPRVTINRGLQLAAGYSSKITEAHLKGTDIDSDHLKLKFTLTKDLSVGTLQLHKGREKVKISAKGPVKSFTQDDINKGFVEYIHEKGESGGSFSFKFNLEDPEGNKVIDESFFITVLEDRLPPAVVVNKGLVLDENSVKKITTLQLSATDQDSEPGELVYRITKQTQLGHLELSTDPGKRISTFTQADLASRNVQYVHTSEEEKHVDDFTFTVSDGANEISQTFYITVRPVDDSLPVLAMSGMRVQEGVRKTITEFELKATDADTEEDLITFTVVQAPRHGTIERTSNGQHYRQTNTFTMDDVYQNRISYHHDGSNSLKDRFTFTVTDGTNMFFILEEGGNEVVTAAPQKFKIDILPVDDGTPRIITNLGLQWLEYMDHRATNLISKKDLLTIDPDTDDGQLIYEITAGPKHGYVESKLKPGVAITSFTQADVNLGLIRYVLNNGGVQETMDNFKFLVKDSKPNIVSDNVFHIQWSLISFEHSSYNVSEKAGTVSVTVKRTGNLNQYAIVLCRTEQGTATSTSTAGSHPGKHDYVEHAGQVQFDEREDTKVCTIVINDDQVFENIESFTVELSMPVYALLGQVTRAKVNINDTEDEPTLQFDKKTYHINESSGFIFVPIERKGDTSSTVSALCYTIPRSAQGSSLHALESGSDYKSRSMSSENRVVLGPGVSMSTCDVTLIDDSEYEPSEEFELVLSDASDNARMGDITVAKIIIDGPNDASTVFLGNASFSFSEDAGTIEIPVLRQGSDLSSVASVWCATRPAEQDSATPGVDYIPSSKKVDFKPGKSEETCSLTIMDDIQNPTIEGKESFIVFLSSPNGAVLKEPHEASVYIIDSTQDLPSMQFEKVAYTVKEKDRVLHIPIVRTGDLTYKSSVRCFTRTMSAMVMDDFEERRNADVSRVVFLKGEKVKNCTVHINDDSVFEPEEEFQVHLGTPQGDHWSGAMIGINDIVTVTITNDEDAPTIEFEQASYQVREPPGPDGIEILNIKVIRKGDLDRTSKIRCSTRDGSAQSGVDYNPKSRVLKFSPGVDHILFKVEILSNEEREWHESFSLVLGPDDPVEAVLGEVTMATVTILDQEAAGSLILPAPPIVVSLSDYDYVQEVTKENSKKSPSPGYPLICVTPCDPHYPKYSIMRERCEEAGINQTSIHFSWEVAAPTDSSGSRSPFETVTDNTPYTTVNHMVLDSIYFSRRFHVRCVAQARDKAGHLGTPLRSNIITIGTEGSICHTPVTTGTARGFQAQSFIATLKYLDVKHKEHPNRIHISVQIPHQDGMLPLVSTMPLHNLHFLLSESIYRQQHICSNLVTLKDLQGISGKQLVLHGFNPNIRELRTIQLYKHLNLKSCIWTFDAYYDMTELIDVCGGSVTADFQVRDSAQSFLTVQVPLYVSYIYVTAPRGWASLEHHTEMEFSFFYDTVLWRTGIQTDSVLSARLQIIRIFIKDDGRLVIEFKTHAKFRGQFVPDHHTLPGHKSHLMAPDHLGGIEFDLQLVWSAQTFDSPYQLWRATSSYSRKDYSGEYTVFLIPCTVQPTQPWIDPGDKPLSCTAHAPEKFLLPIAFQQTNRPVPVVYSLNTEFQLCNNEKVFMMDPANTDMSMAEMDYKGAFSMGQTLYGRVLWNPEQNLNSAYKLQLEKVYLCTGRDGYVPFFDPTGTLYNEGPQYGCIQPNKHLKHRFLLLDRKQPDVCDLYFHDVPFEASFASDVPELQSVSTMPGVDGFTMKVDALYKVEAGHQWYLQVIYVIGPESISSPRVRRSVSLALKRDLSEQSVLDESLIYDNEGEQVKNGTNMKALKLELEPSATFDSHTSGSVGGGVVAIILLIVLLLSSCFLFQKCRKADNRKAMKKPNMEEYPLNTKVEVERLEKNLKNGKCNINLLSQSADTWKVNGVKVKQVNLEVKLHNNLNDGTEV
ncbi:Extracellular matrix protein FRAS1 [Bagarius yarrelli]|uniref:Extracellular matrix protein FRAS1 n=1 Tax=Bagarius yarrelli TaxID=175774 RepID=A0A556U835_BAGYA|nr:Extracellular matrix protein FRAS1 [Bagarius yarrelli]